MVAALLSALLLLLAPSGAVADPPSPARIDRPALLAQLEERDGVRRAMVFRTEMVGVFQCGIRVLGRDPGKLYAWLACGDYSTGPHAKVLSASALPAVVVLDEHEQVARVRFPRQQSLRADIERMFPPRLQDRVIAGDIRTRPVPAVLLDRAENTAPRPPGPR